MYDVRTYAYALIIELAVIGVLGSEVRSCMS